jgi:hypothetical protein
MLLSLFTIFHVLVSVVGIGSGFIVAYGLLTSKDFEGWTKTYLVTTVATSATGFLFPYHGFKPSYVVGILSLIVLGLVIAARYRYGLEGGWRRTYVIGSVTALYFNVFVLVVQLFEKTPALKALAPTQTEPPFLVTQVCVLLVAVYVGVRATMNFHGRSAAAA